MDMELNGRIVIGVEIDGVDYRDYPDFCDAHFSRAVYEDNLEELDDDELDELKDKYSDVLWEMAVESVGV